MRKSFPVLYCTWENSRTFIEEDMFNLLLYFPSTFSFHFFKCRRDLCAFLVMSVQNTERTFWTFHVINVSKLWCFPTIWCMESTGRWGIIVYIEYQSVCPFVGIGSHHSHPRKRVYLPSWTQRGTTLACGWGWGDPIRTTGQKAWHSVYCVVQAYSIEFRSDKLGRCCAMN